MAAGYSKKPLIVKLGLKAGMKARFINTPLHYLDLLGPLPDAVTIARSSRGPIDFIHFFVTKRKELATQLPQLKVALARNGTLWISWPKGTSSVPTEVRENEIRKAGLEAGLVDVKICAVDEDWSGLKFVYRLKDR